MSIKSFVQSAAIAVFLAIPALCATKVVGEFAYRDYLVPKYFPSGATVALMCVSRSLNAPSDEWVPKSEQILGRFTTPFFPAPLKYEIALPAEPECRAVDIDNDGKADAGVRVFAVINAINLFGDSYLEQIEQQAGFLSVDFDNRAGTFRSGALLVFAPDGKQRIPTGFGRDGKLFTSDDPTAPIPAGYSVMRIANRKVTIEQGQEPKIDIVEAEEVKSPDFSDQGYLQSFDSLIDLLKERYAYTALRKIDWEAKRRQFRPRFEKADREKDLQEYYWAIYDFASSMKDGHVQTGSYNPNLSGKQWQDLLRRLGGGLGAEVVPYSDGRFIVYAVAEGSAAAQEGFRLGTEIVKINGTPVNDYLDSVPKMGFPGTQETFVRSASRFLLRFPIGEEVSIEFRQPEEKNTRTARMKSSDKRDAKGFPDLKSYPISATYEFLEDGSFGYVSWKNFEDFRVDLAVFDSFLEKSIDRPGIIIDLRGNTGGLVALYYTMASYFFGADDPVSIGWLDSYAFDDVRKEFVKSAGSGNLKISAPRPELQYKGKVVILIDEHSASAAEFFTQFLQYNKRATVVGESNSEGAGGSVRIVKLPGKVPFTFTGGQMFYAGTKQVNLEGKGVTPDIKIPVNDDTVARKLKGEDVVLTAAIEFLKKTAASPTNNQPTGFR